MDLPIDGTFLIHDFFCLIHFAEFERSRIDNKDVLLHLDGLDASLSIENEYAGKPVCLEEWLDKWVRHLDEVLEEKLLGIDKHVDSETKIMGCCKAIWRMLRILNFVPDLHFDYLVVLMPRVMFLLLRDSNWTTTRAVTWSTVVCIMRWISSKASVAPLPFVMSLLPLFEQESVSVDILVDASCALCFFISMSTFGELHHLLEPKALTLVRILETALATPGYYCDLEILDSLAWIASVPSVQDLLLSRPRLLALLAKRFTSHFVDIQTKVLVLSQILLFPRVNYKNKANCSTGLFVARLAKAAGSESMPLLQSDMVSLLSGCVGRGLLDDMDEAITKGVLASLMEISSNSTLPGVVEMSGMTFIDVVRSEHVSIEHALSGIVVLTTSPNCMVRFQALKLMQEVSFWNKNRAVLKLVESTQILDSLCVLISFGSPSDCAQALTILKHLVFEEQSRSSVLHHCGVLKALVRLVTTKRSTIRYPSYTEAVETLLHLIKEYHYFLPFKSDLLPWLVRTANASSADGGMKPRLVATLIGFVNHLLAGAEDV